ncbi:pangloss1 [Zostera marina]|uniref:Pangloss1 n=1 Tax=Zostera marina TaxID=29655 RepID=A0A0K9PEB3_ZOSMR|nr:pangloss1 [Zostera marina]
MAVSSVFLVLFLFFSQVSGLTTDGLSLLAFKSAISGDPNKSLSTWLESDDTPCLWFGVSCQNQRVAQLSLPGCRLQGYLPSELGLLTSLQVLHLSYNNLSGVIPTQIRTLASLTDLDLSQNSLSGSIPTEVGALENLTHLDLSANQLNGSLPVSVAALPNLSGVLNLSCNALSGEIPVDFGNLPVDVSLDFRRNNLSGEIPQIGSLLNQGPTAFSGNPGLCGFPLKNPCEKTTSDESTDPSIPLLNPRIDTKPDVNFPSPHPSEKHPAGAAARNKYVIVALLSGILTLVLVTVFFLQWHFRRIRSSSEGESVKKKEKKKVITEEKRREGGQGGGEIFVAVDEGFGLELEELLRASAYVVGKSRKGIVYKVVVGRGGGAEAVAVRRLSESEDGTDPPESAWKRRRDFESEAMSIGRVKHPNVVSLRAYYYAPDEKLLVYDYIRNGNLHTALHGGPNTPTSQIPTAYPLSWLARLKIIQGTARGLSFLHDCNPRKYTHGSIKSSKILLDEILNPYISGFGLARLISGNSSKSKPTITQQGSSPSSSTVVDYIAPESRGLCTIPTQKGDVYSFGIVLLEVLTGRVPGGSTSDEDMIELESFVRRAFKEERPLSEIVDPTLHHEVYAKKQVLAVFHVALGCTEMDPELRPRMRSVSESLDRVGSGGGSGGGPPPPPPSL